MLENTFPWSYRVAAGLSRKHLSQLGCENLFVRELLTCQYVNKTITCGAVSLADIAVWSRVAEAPPGNGTPGKLMIWRGTPGKFGNSRG